MAQHKSRLEDSQDTAFEAAGVRLDIGSPEGHDARIGPSFPLEAARLAQLFDQAPGFIAYLAGPDHVYQLVNTPEPGSDLVPDRALLGKSVSEAFPELAGQGVVELLDEVYRSGKTHVASGRRLILATAEGPRETFVDHVYKPVRDEDGSVCGIFIVGSIVTERMQALAAVQEREERLRLALDAGRMAVWDINLVTGSVAPSPELSRIFGLPPDASPSLAEVVSQFLPGERRRLKDISRAARADGERFFEAEFRHVRADDGEVRWCLVRAMTDFSAEDVALRSFGVLMDITERKAAEERLKLLALEVDHRANNLLATVQSVVSLTRADTLDQFRQSILGRIDALATTHRLLAENRWAGASLARIVAEELQPFMAEGQVQVDGPNESLAPAVAQGLAIALHELASNAARHGALSTPRGRIELSWTAPGADGRFEMLWRERGGPPATAPDRCGFGITLLKRALSGSLGGAVELLWSVEGLSCRLLAPVA